LTLLFFSDWNGGWAQDVKFYNNIFYVAGRASYDGGESQNVVFENNVFFGHHSEIPPDADAATNRPPLVKPGRGSDGFASLRGYQSKSGFHFPRGRIVPDNGGRDFFGKPVPPDRPPSIGAAEGPQ
jgi:hypothetical protein